jgi:hypothetical protein
MNTKIFAAQAVVVGTPVISDAIKLTTCGCYFSLQWYFTSAGGNATATIEVLSSNDGVNFVDCNNDIAAAGTTDNTHGFAEVVIIPSMYIKFKVTAAGENITSLNAFFFGTDKATL